MEKEKGALIWIAAVSFVFVIVIGQSLSFLNLGKKEINFNDFSILKYQAEAARKFHKKSGELWGYDPHFMAGYPLDFTWNSNVAIQWTAVKYKKVPVDHILRILLVFGMAIFPLVFWISAKNFSFDTDAASFSMILGGLYFIIGLPIMFFLTGMITAGIASYFSILTVSPVSLMRTTIPFSPEFPAMEYSTDAAVRAGPNLNVSIPASSQILSSPKPSLNR